MSPTTKLGHGFVQDNHYDDPEVGIEWPDLELTVSARDASAPLLSEIRANCRSTRLERQYDRAGMSGKQFLRSRAAYDRSPESPWNL